MDYNDDEQRARQKKFDRIRTALIEKIFKFFTEKEEDYQQELARYYRLFLDVLEESPKELEEQDEFLFILHILIIFDCPIKGKQRIIDLFKEAKAEELTKIEREILDDFLEQPLRPYLIKESKGEKYLIKDLFNGAEDIFTAKNTEFEIGEIITGRLINVGDENQLIGAYNTVPQGYTEFIVESMKNYFLTYKQEFNSRNFEEFLQYGSIFIVKIFKEIHDLEEKDIIYEIKYRVQSRKLARKKLAAHQQIKLEKEQKDFDYLFFIADISAKKEILGEFIIDASGDEHIQLYFRSEAKEVLEEGRRIIKDLLSFTAIYDTAYKINLAKGEIIEFLDERLGISSEKKVIEFIESPLPEEYGAKAPKEMVKDKEDKEKLNEIIAEIELIANLLPDDNKDFFNLTEISQIRKKLGLTKAVGKVYKDGVEELLADKMDVVYITEQSIIDAILIWRKFKLEVKELRGEDRSWAAAVEYLVSRMNYWGMTQKEIGNKYQVSSNTISKKYRQIANKLEIRE